MKQAATGILFILMAFIPGVVNAQGIVVDHNSIPLFDEIPATWLQAARDLRVLFMDRSVGVNTNDALDCFTAGSYGSSRVPCRRDFQLRNGSWTIVTQTDSSLASGLVPAYIRFNPNPGLYNRSRWQFYIFSDSWENMATRFIEGLNNRAIPAENHLTGAPVTVNPLDYDVVSFQFSYLNVEEGSTIADFFTHRPGNYDDVYDLEREVSENLTNANPRRVFVYWTTSLARGIGTDAATNFNQAMRNWCIANNKILFDFADILSHDMNGSPCYDNRDGVPFTTPSGSASENHANDGRSVAAICQEKTTETDGGHLGTAQGLVSVAKGLWITVARIAGWNPGDPSVPPDAPSNLRVAP